MAESGVGQRVDRFIAAHSTELSRSAVQRLIAEGAVSVDGVPVLKASRALELDERVVVAIVDRPVESDLEPEPVAFGVLYEDEHIAVIDKPAGLVVHPAPGHWQGTLVHGLLHRFGERLRSRTDQGRPGIVHRLDRGTSGVMVVALTDRAHAALTRQFAERTVDKEYLAVVFGRMPQAEGVIDAAIGRDRTDRKKISTNSSSPRAATTAWHVRGEFEGITRLTAVPRTGRTHQIRVHLALAGHPIVGDEVYAGRQWKSITSRAVRDAARAFGRPALHARHLEFEHPIETRRLRFSAPVTADIVELLRTGQASDNAS